MPRYYYPDLEECLDTELLNALMTKFAKRIEYAERLTSSQIRGAFVFEFMQLVTWGTVKRLTPPVNLIIKLYNKKVKGCKIYDDRHKTTLPRYKHFNSNLNEKQKQIESYKK